MGISFKPDSPYKLCDLKPFLPIIHADQLTGYDYVGFGDIDLIYGDLSKWLKPIKSRTTLISTHVDRISGHFALLKNSHRILNKAFHIRKWREVLQDNRHYGIDEGRFSAVHFRWLYLISCILQYKMGLVKMGKCFCRFFKHLYPSIYLRELSTTPCPKPCEEWKYHNGHIYNPAGIELPYLHFLFFKKTPYNPGNPLYWKDGFYRIQFPIELENRNICIDIEGIRYDI